MTKLQKPTEVVKPISIKRQSLIQSIYNFLLENSNQLIKKNDLYIFNTGKIIDRKKGTYAVIEMVHSETLGTSKEIVEKDTGFVECFYKQTREFFKIHCYTHEEDSGIASNFALLIEAILKKSEAIENYNFSIPPQSFKTTVATEFEVSTPTTRIILEFFVFTSYVVELSTVCQIVDSIDVEIVKIEN